MKRGKTLLRTHPISIYLYIYRFLYLLLIPLLRGLIAALTGGLLQWISGAWIDILIIFLIITLAYQKWAHYQYNMDKGGIFYTKGIFIQQEGFIPMSRICTLSTQQPLWLRPFRVVRLNIDTLALRPDKADFVFYLHKKQSEQIMALRRRPPLKRGQIQAECKPRTLDIMFLSLFTSNSFIGILFIATFISQAGRILGERLYNILITFFSDLAYKIAISFSSLSALLSFVFRLPPIAMGIGIFLLASWFVAFLLTLLQTKNLCTIRTRKFLRITGGVIVKKEYAILLKHISFIDIRQSLLTRALHLYSVFINAIGTGKERSDITALIPFSARTRCESQLALLLPEYTITPRTISHNAGAIMKFLLDPFWPCLLIPLLTLTGVHYLPTWSTILKFAGFMLSIPAFWFFGVRLMDYVSSGISKSGKYYTMRYSKLYYLHTVVFSSDRIAMIHVRQSILQRTDAKCDLKVSTLSEGNSIHHVKNLSWDDTLELFGAVDPNAFYLKLSWFDKCNLWMRSLFSKKKKKSV